MDWPEITYKVLTITDAQRLSHSHMEEMNNLLSQLGTEEIRIDQGYLAEVTQQSKVVVAIASKQSIVGIACLVPITAITGRSGSISHIVVNEAHRRYSIASGMLRCLINEARRLSLRRLDLTSSPTRLAA